MKIAVTGASGLIGSALVPALRADGHEVLRLVRRAARAADEVRWDLATRQLDPQALAEVDAVIHLAGAGVADKRWTSSYRAQILGSRVDSTATIAQALAAAPPRQRILLSGSAVGFYGDGGDRELDESSPGGAGFLADLVRRWEAETEPAEQAGVRVLHLRTGVVLAREGGALPLQARVARLGLGAPLGSGRQWVSWITLADHVAATRHLLSADGVSGPVNLVGPSPVTNRDFTKVLNQVLRRPTVPVPVPAGVLRLALGGFADEGVLIGQRLRPAVLERSGFTFAQPDLETALSSVLG